MDVPDEIVVEWCSNDLFKPDETNVTVVHASVHRVTLPMFLNTKNESDLLTPTQAGIMVRLWELLENMSAMVKLPWYLAQLESLV